MTRRRRRFASVFGLRLGLCLTAAAGAAEAAPEHGDEPELAPVTPYRPSVSNPAQLPAAGQVELELGGLRSRLPGISRSGIPYLLKLGFDADWGVLIGGDAHVWQHADAGGAATSASPAPGGRRRARPSSSPAWSCRSHGSGDAGRSRPAHCSRSSRTGTCSASRW